MEFDKGILGNKDLKSGQKISQSGLAVLGAAPGLIKGIGAKATTKGGRFARGLEITSQTTELGAQLGGPWGAAAGLVAGVGVSALTGKKAMTDALEKERTDAEQVFTDQTEDLNREYFLNQGYSSIESAKDILRKSNGYV